MGVQGHEDVRNDVDNGDDVDQNRDHQDDHNTNDDDNEDDNMEMTRHVVIVVIRFVKYTLRIHVDRLFKV